MSRQAQVRPGQILLVEDNPGDARPRQEAPKEGKAHGGAEG